MSKAKINKPTYKKFVKWYASHPKDRSPAKLEDFLTENNITPEEFQAFKDYPDFYSDLAEATKEWGQTRIAEVVHKLYDRSMELGNSKDIEAFIKTVMPTKEEEEEEEAFKNPNLFRLENEQRKQIIDRISGRDGFARSGGAK